MDYATATDVYLKIRASKLADLREDVIDTALRYARMRIEWLRAVPEKQAQIGADRSACHNALVVACDVLSRNMVNASEDNSWRRTLGDDRKRIGDFACYLHCILGISAR